MCKQTGGSGSGAGQTGVSGAGQTGVSGAGQSDEQGAPSGLQTGPRCILRRFKCDEIPDCPFGDDEDPSLCADIYALRVFALLGYLIWKL